MCVPCCLFTILLILLHPTTQTQSRYFLLTSLFDSSIHAWHASCIIIIINMHTLWNKLRLKKCIRLLLHHHICWGMREEIKRWGSKKERATFFSTRVDSYLLYDLFVRNANCIDKTDVGPTFYFFVKILHTIVVEEVVVVGWSSSFLSQNAERLQNKKKYSCIQVLVSLLHVESWWMISEEWIEYVRYPLVLWGGF